jgi:hypothetical protein
MSLTEKPETGVTEVIKTPTKIPKIYSEIRINGGFASIFNAEYNTNRKGNSIPKIRKSSVPFDLFISKLNRSLTGFSDKREASIIPENCRYHEVLKGGQGHLIVVEEPPMIRTVLLSNSQTEYLKNIYSGNTNPNGSITPENKEMLSYVSKIRAGYQERLQGSPLTLSFPYVVMIILFQFRNGFFDRMTSPLVFFKRSPLVGLSDPLFIAPLSNISGEFEMCIGSGLTSDELTGLHRKSLTYAMKYYRKLFWNNLFNTDFMTNQKMYEDIAQVSNFATWSLATKENPSFIYTVPWKKARVDFAGALSLLKSRLISTESSTRYKSQQYAILERTIQEPVEADKEDKYKRKLYYDVTGEYHIDESTFLLSGDMITLPNKKKILFESFIGSELHSMPSHYRLLINDKHRIIIPIKRSFNTFISKTIKEATTMQKIKTQHGIIKVGDIISFDKLKDMSGIIGNRIKKVEAIRVKGDNTIDVVLNDNLCIRHEAFPKFETVDVDNLFIGQYKFDKHMKTERIMFARSNKPLYFMYQHCLAKFKELNLVNERFTARFEPSPDLTRVNIIMPLTLKPSNPDFGDYQIIKDKDLMKFSKNIPINWFGGLYSGQGADYFVNKSFTKIFSEKNIILTKPKIKDIFKDINKTGRIEMFSFGFPLDFNIGDNVVIFDTDPINMLTVRKIIGMNFKDSKEGSSTFSSLNFVTKDQKGNILEFPFINETQEKTTVKMGKIRKVVGKVEGLSYGFKIKSIRDGIPCFPKDSVNIIVAFISDTLLQPMVLLSNARTLWLSDVLNERNFEIYNDKHKDYEKLEHAMIMPEDFVIQDGDIVSFSKYKSNFSGIVCIDTRIDSEGEGIIFNTDDKAVHIIDLNNFSPNNNSNTTSLLTRDRLRIDSIPSPRLEKYYQTTKPISLNPSLLIPTLYGEFIEFDKNYNKAIKNSLGNGRVIGFSSDHRRLTHTYV